MANTLLTINQITNEALNVLENELTGHVEYAVEGRGMKWVVVKRLWGETKEVIAQYKAKEEAEAVLKIINFTEGIENESRE